MVVGATALSYALTEAPQRRSPANTDAMILYRNTIGWPPAICRRRPE
jgi:hypothetical protein